MRKRTSLVGVLILALLLVPTPAVGAVNLTIKYFELSLSALFFIILCIAFWLRELMDYKEHRL